LRESLFALWGKGVISISSQFGGRDREWLMKDGDGVVSKNLEGMEKDAENVRRGMRSRDNTELVRVFTKLVCLPGGKKSMKRMMINGEQNELGESRIAKR
jgi:hypothetical protein